jgi:putative lipase involved disintegration of autophagic bodies
VKAHNGFLYVSRNMAPMVHAAISSRIEQADRVLLTGHSAGGAVAALLFAHLKLSNAFRQSCPDALAA